ncbi:MAG: glucose-1-phosphate adenylyltransferase, partial [Clostridia bacterium]|nr:glucose-1-phosphate adenylyltransferase [Clostridia bacterium]
TKASMGVYVFSKDKLFEYLTADEADPDSETDFGKNVIPAMLKAGERLFAFGFEGYWKDVGTIQSLWEANMDLLGDRPKLTLFDPDWKIYSRNAAQPPQYVGEKAVVRNSIVTEGCRINGTVVNSVLSAGVVVEEGAVVEDSVLFEGVSVRSGARISYAVVDEGTDVGRNASVGKPIGSAKGIALVGAGLKIPEGAQVPDSVRLDEDLLKELTKDGGRSETARPARTGKKPPDGTVGSEKGGKAE